MATSARPKEKAAAATDTGIQSAILSELRWDPRVPENEIGVAVKGGIVMLTGFVDSYQKRWAAEDAAQRVRGVKAVANDIVVRLSPQDQRTDADLAEAAVRALEWDTALSLDRLQVSVSQGVITLKGEVDWQYKREDAERVVRRLAGTRSVVNAIVVKPLLRPDDLQRQIEEALVRSAQTDAGRIAVEVDGGKVTLRGKVRAWIEKQEAERAAWQAPGVVSVDNQISVVI